MKFITVKEAFEQKLIGTKPYENIIIREIATKRVIAYPEIIVLSTDRVVYCPDNTNEHIQLLSTEVEYLKED